MKTLRFSLILLISLATLSLAACSSNEPPTDTSATKPAETSSTPATSAPSDPVSKSTVGELQKVDLAARTVTIKNGDGNTETFFFTESTQIVGTADAQGLSLREGSQVTVGYTVKDGHKTAVRIEVVPK